MTDEMNKINLFFCDGVKLSSHFPPKQPKTLQNWLDANAEGVTLPNR